MTSAQLAATACQPVSTAAEARQLVDHLGQVMDALLAIVEEENRSVRAGRIAKIAPLEPAKADLARLYLAATARLKASMPYLSAHHPKMLAILRQRHDTFHALLQINLTVLATARAVAEGIMRGVSQELSRKAAPQLYGASGGMTIAHGRYAQPLAVSRSL